MKSRNDVWLDAITSSFSEPLTLRVRGRSMLPTLRPGDEVLIESVLADSLVTGDWVAVRSAEGGFLHRYLGLRDGRMLTKGDGHPGFDPLWMPEAVLGRVVEARREGRCFFRRTIGQMRRERLLATGHRVVGDVWELARRLKALFLALFALFLGVSLVAAAVVLADFSAEAGTDRITLKWETGSETNNLGFYLWRSLTETVGYVNISGFIDSQDDGAGAFYEYEDVDALSGIIYYYTLQDVPADGTTGEFTDPITASIELPDDATPTPETPTVTPSPTATNTPGPTPTETPVPPPATSSVSFWAEETVLDAGDCTTLRWQTENIKAVFLDGEGVSGDGAKTLCPCEAETYILSVTYSDDTAEDFEVTLTVEGECADPAKTSTPTTTPVPTSTPAPDSTDSPTATWTPVPSPTRPTATSTPEPSPVSSATPEPAQAAITTEPPPTLSPVPAATATRGVVEGDAQGVEVDAALSVWLLVVGGIVGLGLIGAGVLMWKHQQ